MKRVYILVAIGIASLMLASTTTSPALAWHPQGKIQKTVQDITSNIQASDANDTASALDVHPGDVLQYTITVTNTAEPAANSDNDLAFVTVSDMLPDGVEFADQPSQREFNEDLGTIVPGKSITKTYTVKVTDQTDGSTITNKACFQGNSVVKDNPQEACDVAIIKVNLPPKPSETPAPTPPAPAKALPNTGAGSIVLPSLIASTIAYGIYLLMLKRRSSSK